MFHSPVDADFEDRIRRMARKPMTELGRDGDEIVDVVEPLGAHYCMISFHNPELKPIEVSESLGAGDSQRLDEVHRASQYGFGT